MEGEGSILEGMGEEIVRIVSPVSICMLLVVVLVRSLLQEEDASDSLSRSSLSILVYDEKGADSDWHKFWGALLNAAVFVAVVTVVTFLLVLLFYFRCTKFLRVYMGVAAFTVLAYMGGSVAILLIEALSIPIDAVSSAVILYNFAIVGVLSVFFCKVPILFTQGYLVLVGMLVAFWFASLPEWTTWVLLVAMAVYDIVAVLTPGGPLNILVELAMSRDEEIPALIYEARPITTPLRRSGEAMMSAQMSRPPSENSAVPQLGQRRRWKRRCPGENSSLLTRLTSGFTNDSPALFESQGAATEEEQEGASTPLQYRCTESELNSTVGDMGTSITSPFSDNVDNENAVQIQDTTIVFVREGVDYEEPVYSRVLTTDDERRPLTNLEDDSSSCTAALAVPGTAMIPITTGSQENALRGGIDLDEGMGLGASGAIKLGLGDFIFYSVLVGRAAMYDMMTVYACYLAIIAGLGATLVLLAVWRRALPALPISVSLGVIFYFLTRLLMEPFMVQCSTRLLFF